MMLLPGNFLYQMSSWTRAIVMPLSIVHAANPRRPVPAGFNLEELFLPGVPPQPSRPTTPASSAGAISSCRVDRVLKWWERSGSAARSRARPSPGAEQWMLERFAALRRAGRHLSAHDVRHHGARRARLRARTTRSAAKRSGSSTTCWSTTASASSSSPASRRCGTRPSPPTRWAKPAPRAEPACARAADWLLDQGSPPQGRLVASSGPTSSPPAGTSSSPTSSIPTSTTPRMVLLALRARPRRPIRERTQACMRPRRRLAAGDAVEGRRLGGVRRRQQLGVPERRAVRRSQRDARSDLPGHHRPRARSAVRAAASTAIASGRAARRRVPAAHAGSRRQLVRPLGRRLHLRHVPRAARTCAPPARDDREAHVLRAGEWLRSIQNADGGWGESCASYDNGTFVAGREHAFADRLGGAGTARRRRHHQPERAATASSTCSRRSAPTAAGTKHLSTGTGFPRVFYLNYHLYRDSFPLLALAAYREDEEQRR